MFADIKATELLKINPVNQAPQPQRRLNSQNNLTLYKYLEELTKELNDHKVYQRAGKLLTHAKKCYITITHIKEYNSLDQTTTLVILSADNKIPHKSTKNWTIELNRIVHKIR